MPKALHLEVESTKENIFANFIQVASARVSGSFFNHYFEVIFMVISIALLSSFISELCDFNKKIRYILLLPPVMSLMLSFCSDPISETLDVQAINEYEIELDSVMNQIKDIDIKESPDEFISLYINTLQILDILPDTSELN